MVADSFSARGILKNSRSQSGSEQMLTLDGQDRPGERYVASRDLVRQILTSSLYLSLHWDEGNIALTEIERDSVM